jgi:branched-chain amino acid transport system ATP-binding protein
MKNSLLQIRNLTMKFGGLTAMDSVSFELTEDRILALIGPNGAGKTTLFNVVSGIYAPTSGDILFKGTPINGLPPHEIARMGIKRTFQQSRLCESLSVLDNVLTGLGASSKSNFRKALFNRPLLKKELSAEIDQARELLGVFSRSMRDSCFRPVSDLPPGERRKLEICRALVSDPAVLLLDEPAAGMDPEETLELMEDIRRISALKKGIGIVLIEHDMSIVRKIAEEVIVLSYGKIISTGSFAKVASDPLVQEAYLGNVENPS